MSHVAAYLVVTVCLATAAGHGKRAVVFTAAAVIAVLCLLFAILAWVAEWLGKRLR